MAHLLANPTTAAASAPHPGFPPEIWAALWSRCWPRIRSWPVPPRWSPRDWWETARVEGILAACLALREYDPLRSVPLEAFLYRRILAGVWSQHRREWAYGRRHQPLPDDDSWDVPTEFLDSTSDPERAQQLLERLGEPDRWLLRRLYLDGQSETAVAAELGISQQAVSRRKLWALAKLRLPSRE